jgi:hypothetical protein
MFVPETVCTFWKADNSVGHDLFRKSDVDKMFIGCSHEKSKLVPAAVHFLQQDLPT